jgi:O-methyltransferase domain/Dimerisation domain
MSQGLPPSIALFRLVTGYYVSCAIHAVAELGIADLLKDGPQSHDTLAAGTGTHAASLRRVLRLLASAGVLVEEEDGRFSLTAIGACLRDDVPGSMRAAALLFGGPAHHNWLDLPYSLQTGEPAFRRTGASSPFAQMAEHPEEAANFDKAMANFTRQIAPVVAAAYDFSGFGTIVDIGGGNGVLLEGILEANPRLRGIVFDLAHVVERARLRIATTAIGDRCTIHAGDFFREVPGGGDAYLLKHVIHDWNDERALAILATCRKAMRPDAKLLVVEGVYPPRIDQSEPSRGAAANDVNMLVSTGGRQRSADEFRALYAAAGFALSRIVPTPARVSVIEGRPQ